ncbi:MAG TPA: SPOR domain-containing protein [Coleofasciculaceae cyanobacterium]
MSYKSSVESSTQSSSNPSINPALQAALGSLDVQLEEELARYRRQRSGRPVMPPRGLGRNQIRKPIELISVNKPKSQTPPSVTNKTSTTSSLSFPLALVSPTPTTTPLQQAPHEEIAEAVQAETPEATPPEQNSPLVIPTAISGVAESLTMKEEPTEQPSPPETALEEGRDIVAVDEAQDQPEDYMESSEKLLQSLTEEEPTSEPQKRSSNRFLTPLSVGLVLLLLLSSATVGYIFSNPSTMTALGLNRFFGSTPPTTGQNPAEGRVASSNPPKDLPMVEGPNLASDEFPDVNLNTLSQLQTSPTLSPSSLPSPSVSPVPSVPNLPNSGAASSSAPAVPNLPPTGASDLSSGLLQGTLQPQSPTSKPPLSVAPIPTLPPSQPSTKTPNSSSTKAKPSPSASAANANKQSEASASTTAEVASGPEAGDPFYYVLTSYGGDRSLEQARAVVPDAYLRKFSQGTRIQLGAFKRESEAKTLVEQLQRQGVSASVYRP